MGLYKMNVAVEARQVTETNAVDIARWCGTQHQMIIAGPPVPIKGEDGSTLFADVGDWVIKDPRVEQFGVMNDQAFKEIFELVAE